MAVDYLGRETRIIRTDSNTEYFDYYGRPRDISIDVYVRVYEKFCEAYGVEVLDADVNSLSFYVKRNILDRNKPDGVRYNPKYYSNAILYIMPKNDRVRFRSFSYTMQKENCRFVNLANRFFRKHNNLEDRVEC